MSVNAPVPSGPTLALGTARFVGRRLRDWVPAAAFLVLGLVAWQVLVSVLSVQRFLLPKPTQIASAFWNERHSLWSAGWFTFQEAVGGFVVGSGLAILVGLVLARWKPLRSAVMPYAIAANAIPIIAFAPITNAWFSPLSKSSKIAIAAVLCFFPVLVNTIRGLTSVKPQSIELMRSYAAGELEIFRRVRVPAALPYIFTALKVASVLAMIGAIVGEYFGGSIEALGVQIKNSASLFQFETAWAAILVASLLGIAFYLAVALAERIVTRWQPTPGRGE
ncbi:MAG: NitT/TauT family transport system permease protein [Gaiellaceae bacterium]|nr:NitT/TauT family transport system permease protein [Gaiellaceae bacterium]MDX6543987.1 NitT/TauT family transport system permease protein [Gaiellaceae bacterium]